MTFLWAGGAGDRVLLPQEGSLRKLLSLTFAIKGELGLNN